MVPLAKVGLRMPELGVRLDRVALDEGPRVITIVYVSVVVPSCAVTIVVIVLVPTLRPITPDAVPLVTGTPFTVTMALTSLVVGVTVIDAVALGTMAV